MSRLSVHNEREADGPAVNAPNKSTLSATAAPFIPSNPGSGISSKEQAKEDHDEGPVAGPASGDPALQSGVPSLVALPATVLVSSSDEAHAVEKRVAGETTMDESTKTPPQSEPARIWTPQPSTGQPLEKFPKPKRRRLGEFSRLIYLCGQSDPGNVLTRHLLA